MTQVKKNDDMTGWWTLRMLVRHDRHDPLAAIALTLFIIGAMRMTWRSTTLALFI